ncbi:3956_t:CDS:2, partial [Dentiscutata erythropus]
MNNENKITDWKIISGILYGVGYNINKIIGAGIFNPDVILKLVQSPGIALLLFIVCGFISILGSLIYIELGIRSLPSGIGEQKYISDAFPSKKNFGNNFGHVFSYVAIFIILPGEIVAVSYSCAQYLLYIPRGNFINDYDPTAMIVSVLILLVITLYHASSKKISDYINQSLALIKVISLLIISIVGLVKLAANGFANWINVFNVSSNSGVYEFGAYGNGLIQ